MLALVLAFASLASFSSIAEAQATPDVVRLRDGSYYRGTIVERSPAQVILLLPNGESRTFPADQVELAGPDAPPPVAAPVPPPPQVIAAAPSGPRMARVRVETDDRDVTLQRLTGTGSVTVWTGRGAGTVAIDAFELVCNAPCDVEVPEGTYQLGAALGTRQAVRAGRPVELRGDMHLRLDYEDHEGDRVAGWVTFGVGYAAGTALLFAGLFAFKDDCYGSYYCGPSVNVPMVATASAVYLGTTIAFFVLAFRGDGAALEDLSRGVRF